MAARNRDPMFRSIIMERLLSAEYSLQSIMAHTSVVGREAEYWMIWTMMTLLHHRSFTLLRDFLDPRPLPRWSTPLAASMPDVARRIQYVRGWRRKFPQLEVV